MENAHNAHLFGTSEQFYNLRTGFKFYIDVNIRLDAIDDFSVDVNSLLAGCVLFRSM